MTIKSISFRFRIVITLILVVSVASFSSLYFYNNTLNKKIFKTAEEDTKNFLVFFKDQIIAIHDGRNIKPILRELDSTKGVIRSFLISAGGEVQYPDTTTLMLRDSLDFASLPSMPGDVMLKSHEQGKEKFARAFIRFDNGPQCTECHQASETTLGYIVMDLTMASAEDTFEFTRNFSVFFTVLMITVIMTFIMILHYRFIRKSLSNFKLTINQINDGNLESRVHIPGSKELGELGGNFNTMLDNFQRTQLELSEYHRKELETAEKLATIGEMAARLAHDVRNPLTGIANAIEIIAADMQDSPNKPVIEEIRRQSARVNVAITNLLKFARSAEIKKHRGNINDLLNNLVFFLRNQKQNSRMVFDLEADPKVPEIEYDAEQMENVLMNLCINAIQAMRNEGEIKIRTKLCKGSDTILISIEDNGPGIPNDIEESIFKPFFTTRTEGTGLGLAIAKDIVEKHRGKIWFDTNRKIGTIFYISLPLNPNGTVNPANCIRK